MKPWQELVRVWKAEGLAAAKDRADTFSVYPKSLHEAEGSLLFITKEPQQRRLAVAGAGPMQQLFHGVKETADDTVVKLADMDHENCQALRGYFGFTKPRAFGRQGTSMGLGDRLGLASPGHIATVQGTGVRPVLAQQSMRELDLTGRTYDDVLDAASWAVFQEGYHEGFGADGDHLKNAADIQMALDIGYSMITLDCSDHIDNTVVDASEEEVEVKFAQLTAEEAAVAEQYIGVDFQLQSGTVINFTERQFKRAFLIYKEMISFTKHIYDTVIGPCGRDVDFEVSIDETASPTLPEEHFLVARELHQRGVAVNSLAPRFCGEFQKGIDYIGDLTEFEKEFVIHAGIAEHFGYKLSIHSGSDKFSVFPIIGKHTNGRVHVKTAGTSWLEAMRVVAEHDPGLYREIHQFALDHFAEALKIYKVTTDLDKIPDVWSMKDQDLPGLMDHNDARQLIHITYGLILQDRTNGRYTFNDRLYDLWQQSEEEYKQVLQKHIGRHMQELGVEETN